jgi:hypothetical protein
MHAAPYTRPRKRTRSFAQATQHLLMIGLEWIITDDRELKIVLVVRRERTYQMIDLFLGSQNSYEQHIPAGPQLHRFGESCPKRLDDICSERHVSALSFPSLDVIALYLFRIDDDLVGETYGQPPAKAQIETRGRRPLLPLPVESVDGNHDTFPEHAEQRNEHRGADSVEMHDLDMGRQHVQQERKDATLVDRLFLWIVGTYTHFTPWTQAGRSCVSPRRQ